jgi:hypothetical protein
MFVLAASSAQPAVPVADPISNPESYAVYAELFPDGSAVPELKRVIIQRETVTEDRCAADEPAPEGRWSPVMEDFVRQNAAARELQRSFSITLPYELVPASDLKSVMGNAGADWEAFYARYPESGGFVRFSAVGFNESRTLATVYMEQLCGTRCGGGAQLFLEKQDGRWLPSDPGIRCRWVP